MNIGISNVPYMENPLDPQIDRPGRKEPLNVKGRDELMTVSGYMTDGTYTKGSIQYPYFFLSVEDRVMIVKKNSDVFGIISGRMQTISGIEWQISRKVDEEEQTVDKLRMYQELFTEYGDPLNIRDIVVRKQMYQKMREELVDLKPDMSNFEASLRRWKKKNKRVMTDSKMMIEDWVNKPNSDDDFEEFKKKWVFDLHTHGASAIYKQYYNGDMIGIYMLPGGSVLPLRHMYVGPGSAYAQILPALEPRILSSDEIVFDNYMPTSDRSYGLVPLEALVNKIAESLLFDERAAAQADGTRPPEKLIAFGETGNLGFDLNTPFQNTEDVAEQERLQQIVTMARKEAIAVITGKGTPVAIDLSKADTFAAQSDRQDKLLRAIALVFSASNIEVNLTGSEDTSGRATSETQERIDQKKGIGPVLRIIDKTMTDKIIPCKFGPGWVFKHKGAESEYDQVELEAKKLQSGTYTVNELRDARGAEPIPDEAYDKPPGGTQAQAGSNQTNPLFTRQL